MSTDYSKYTQVKTISQALYWLCDTDGAYEITKWSDCVGLSSKSVGGLWVVFAEGLLESLIEKGFVVDRSGAFNQAYKVTTEGHRYYWTKVKR